MIKRFTFFSFLISVVFQSVSNVMAEGISYDYAQADYISDTVDLDGSTSDVEGNGIGFSVSLSFASAFAVKLAVVSTTFRDFHGKRVDSSKATTLGVTAHTSVASKTDVFSNVSVIKAEITADNGDDKTGGSEISAIIDLGIRHRLMDKLELEALVSRVKIFSYTLNSIAVGGRFYFNKQFSVGASYVANDIHDSLLISGRMDI